MWKPFILDNLHFVINAFGALAFFSIFWLYLDAWLPRKNLKEGLKVAGFLLLALAFLVQATIVESSLLTPSLFGSGINNIISLALRLSGYLLVAIGIVSEGGGVKNVLGEAKAVWFLPMANFALAPLAASVGWLYLRKATLNYEKHLKKVGIGFFVLASYELLALREFFSASTNIDVFEITSAFGPIWIVEHIAAFSAFLVLFSWAFSYLLKRINTQLFIIFATTTLAIFLLTAVSFSFLLVKNLQDDTLGRLETDASVLSFALDAKKEAGKAIASSFSQNSRVLEAINEGDRNSLATIARDVLIENRLSSVVILDAKGVVLARGEERARVGDSLSEDTLVKRAIMGKSDSSVETRAGAIAPTVTLRTAAPIKSDEELVGIVVLGVNLDNAFVDGIKLGTGLEAAIFAGETLSATTITDFTGKGRPLGIKETNKEVLNQVLTKGEKMSTLTNIFSSQYFASYHPLKDIDGVTVGMVLTGKPAISVLATAGHSIFLTFLISALLMVFSLVPSYFISTYIARQLK